MECRKYMQVVTNGVLTIPDHIPDVDFILRVTSTPIIENAIVMDKQISFSGHILVCIEMVSSKHDCPQTLHFASFRTPFIGLIDHHCARAGMDVQLSASIKHQDFKMVNHRCINKLIVVRVCILRLIKSCKPLNAHCSEPRLTLLCRGICPQASPKAIATPPLRTDCHSEPKDYYLPQTLHNSDTEQATTIPCAICGCKID